MTKTLFFLSFVSRQDLGVGRCLPAVSVKAVLEAPVAGTNLNFIREGLLLMPRHESLQASSSLDHCPREMSMSSCEVQRGTL